MTEEVYIPFLDTFYSLSSNDKSQRSFAASSLLHHVFITSENKPGIINEDDAKKTFDLVVKDGCYAMNRLLKGLCSGRASVRQGYASCFSSFLKLAFNLIPTKSSSSSSGNQAWIYYFMEQMGVKANKSSNDFVREKLLECTYSKDASIDKKGIKKGRKGSEERDYYFGKLFGILAVVRSGTLRTDVESDVTQTLKGYVGDLLELFNSRKWMREPAMHGLKELLNFISTESDTSLSIIVEETELNTFLAQENNWNVEKLSLFLHLQTVFHNSKAHDSGIKVPVVLMKNMLSVSSLEGKFKICDIAKLLKETSTVVHPRCHMVWESVWSFLCEEKDANMTSNKKKKSGLKIETMVLRETSIIGNDTPNETLLSIVNNVIVDGLLKETESNSITHERRALAMSLVYQLCQMKLPPQILERVILHPSIVSKLFVQTLQTCTRRKNAQKEHTLRSLALYILQHIVSALTSKNDSCERRMAAIRSFLLVHPSFDLITHTSTVSKLLGFRSENSELLPDSSLYQKYFLFLQEQIVKKATQQVNIHDAIKFVDLLFNFTKCIFRNGNNDLRQLYFRQTSQLLMTCAFFSLESFYPDGDKHQDLTQVAHGLYQEMKDRRSRLVFPYELRVVLSSRFFSVVSDFMTTYDKGKLRNKKTSLVISELSQLYLVIKVLEDCGALLLNKGEMFSYQGTDIQPLKFCEEVFATVKEQIAQVDTQNDESKSFVLSTVLSLLFSLGILMLHPGHQKSMDKSSSPELEETDEIFEEIRDNICDLSDLADRIKGGDVKIRYDNDGDEGKTLMNELAAICTNILNSCVGGNISTECAHLGSGPKLVRDCVELMWGSMLAYKGKKSEKFEFNEEFLGLLLETVCLAEAFSDPMDLDEHDSDTMNGSDGIDDDSNSGVDIDLGAFVKANAAGLVLDDAGTNKKEYEEKLVADDMDEDVELDPTSLENLLLEDPDDVGSDEESMLEHHEGADKALVQLIKLKQEARKSGRSKREKMDLANRMRCFPLLEAIFSSNMRNVLTNQMKLAVILPLLRTRTILFKSLESIKDPSLFNQGTTSAPEKRALMKKITSFLYSRICKGSMSKEQSNYSSCETLAKQIMIEMKSISNKDHGELCSSLLVQVIKAAGGDDLDVSKNFANAIYRDAVQEWSQKRSTKLQSTVFDTLIAKHESIAPSVLVDTMVSASCEARSPYLKSESFRLLSALFQIAEKSSGSLTCESDIISMRFCESMNKALHDSDLIKAKRMREVLNCFDRFLSFYNSSKRISNNKQMQKLLKELVVPMQKLMDSSSSNSIKFLCDKLSKRIVNEFKEEDPDGKTLTKETKDKKKKKNKKQS